MEISNTLDQDSQTFKYENDSKSSIVQSSLHVKQQILEQVISHFPKRAVAIEVLHPYAPFSQTIVRPGSCQVKRLPHVSRILRRCSSHTIHLER
jgi:hypothetical protein